MGVDTHNDVHLAVALDGLGRRLGTLNVPTSLAGYKELVAWANGFGPLERAGVEGTGAFGCGLARLLQAEGIEVLEVIRPRRRDQYRSGKSDPIDAEAAARAVLAGTATGRPKGTNGEVEMIRALRAARRSAVKAPAQVANQLKAMLITAPEGLKRASYARSPQPSWLRRFRGFGRGRAPRTWKQPPSSRCARWRAVTSGSPKKSLSSRSNWIV